MNNSDILNNRINDNLLNSVIKNSSDNHINGQTYSAEILKDDLIKQLKDTRKRITEIQQQIRDNEENRKKLLIELRKHENIFERLMLQVNSIDMGSSVNQENFGYIGNKEKSILKNDKKLADFDSEIAEKEAQINNLRGSSNLLSAKRLKKREERLKNQLLRLKDKKGIIEDKQRRIINSKLDKYYKNVLKESKKFGKTHAIEELRLDRDSELRERISSSLTNAKSFEIHSNNSGRVIGSAYALRSKISYANQGILKQYCKLLSKKDGVLNSFRRVDKSVIERVHMNYGFDFVNGDMVLSDDMGDIIESSRGSRR